MLGCRLAIIICLGIIHYFPKIRKWKPFNCLFFDFRSSTSSSNLLLFLRLEFLFRLTPIPLLQPWHPRLANLCILRIKSLKRIRLNNRRKLDLIVPPLLRFTVCSPNYDWEWIGGVEVWEWVWWFSFRGWFLVICHCDGSEVAWSESGGREAITAFLSEIDAAVILCPASCEEIIQGGNKLVVVVS